MINFRDYTANDWKKGNLETSLGMKAEESVIKATEWRGDYKEGSELEILIITWYF